MLLPFLIPESVHIQEGLKFELDRSMTRFLRRFLQDTSGAVTVDW
jgi:hypothetical protein